MVTLEDKTNEGFIQGLYRHTRRFIVPTTLAFSSLLFNGCGGKASNPTSFDEPKTEEPIRRGSGKPPEPLSPKDFGIGVGKITSGITNSQGRALFKEENNSEDVEIFVRDSFGNPLEGFNVHYFDGDRSEVFVAEKDGYLTTMGIFSHNSIHTLKSERVGSTGMVHLQTINDDEGFRALIRYDNKFSHPTVVEYVYDGTITESERLESYNQQLLVARLFDIGAKANSGGESPSVEILGLNLPISMEKLAPYLSPHSERKIGGKARRYDVYSIKTTRTLPTGKTLTQTTMEIFPSNEPSVVIHEPRIENGKLIFSWEGRDQDVYEKTFPGLEKENNKIVRQDATVLLGKTKESDLEYSFRYFRDGQLRIFDNITDNVISVGGISEGRYRFEVDARDEVGNIGSDWIEFTLKEEGAINTIPRITYHILNLKAIDDIASSAQDPISMALKLGLIINNPQFDAYNQAGFLAYYLQRFDNGKWTGIPIEKEDNRIAFSTPLDEERREINPTNTFELGGGLGPLKSYGAHGAEKVRAQVITTLNGADNDTSYTNEVPIKSVP